MNTTTAIPASIDIVDLMKAAGSNLADPRVVFSGDVFDGKKEFAQRPIESVEAYSNAVYSEFETTTIEQAFPGMTTNELAVAVYSVLRLSRDGKPQPVSNDPGVQPGTRRVDIGYDWDSGVMQNMSIPSGEMSLPGFRGKTAKWQPTIRVLNPGSAPYLVANIIRGDQDPMQGLFEMVRSWADQHSIYLGQVFDQNFDFIKMTDFKPENVAMTDAHRNAVNLFVRGPLQFAAGMDDAGIPPKSGLFLHGPAGGGKTMIMSSCAYMAARSGAAVCMIHPESGIGGFNQANAMTLRLMKAGHKVMLCMEDMEKLAKQSRATVLEILDGGEAKGLRRIVVGTTNFVDQIDRAMLRPGRFDGCEYAGLPDLAAFEQLLHILLKDKDLSDVDFIDAFVPFKGYTYAFIANAVTNILRAQVIRNRGETNDDKITTEDLKSAAMAVRGHFDLLQKPVEVEPPKMEAIMARIVATEVDEQLDMRNFSDDVDYDYVEEKARQGADAAIEGRLHNASIVDGDGDYRYSINTN